MGIKLLKLLSITIALALSVFTLFLGHFLLSEGRHPIDPYIDTCFALDFSPEKFNDIKVGMSIDEVKSIIGEPLSMGLVSDNSGEISYIYTNDGKLLQKSQEKGKSKHYDCAWCLSSITIDTNNIVIDINKKWIYD